MGDNQPKPIERCTSIETNTLSNDGQAMRRLKILQLTINGEKQMRKVAGFSLEMLSENQLRTYAAHFDREGIVETPVYRCIYRRSF